MAGFFSQRSEETEGGDYFVRPRPGQDCRNGKVGPSMTHSFKKNYRSAIILGVIFVAVFFYASPARAIYNGYEISPPIPGIVLIDIGPDPWRPEIRCSGALITPQLVLTSAQCFAGVPHGSGIRAWSYPNNVAVRLDGLDFQISRELAFVFLVQSAPASIQPIGVELDFIVGSNPMAFYGFGPPCTGGQPDGFCSTGFPVLQRAQYIGSLSVVCNKEFWGGNDDTGGPLVFAGGVSWGKIDGVAISGTCGHGGSDHVAWLHQYSEVISQMMALHGGTPYCTASISPQFGSQSTVFTATLRSYGAQTCRYVLIGGNDDLQGSIPCGNPVSKTFANLTPGYHALIFNISRPGAPFLSGCVVGGFQVSGNPADPAISNIQSSNPTPQANQSVTLTVNVLGGIGPYRYSWENPTYAAVTETQTRFAAIPSDINALAGAIFGLFRNFFSWPVAR